MLSGVTSIAWAMVGTAVLRMVVSSDCMKKAIATSHGSRRLIVSVGASGTVAVVVMQAGADCEPASPFQATLFGPARLWHVGDAGRPNAIGKLLQLGSCEKLLAHGRQGRLERLRVD